jgi:hypothetical protein
MSDEPKRKRRSRATYAAFLCTAMLVLYVISVGPTASLEWHVDRWDTGLITKVRMEAYRPLRACARVVNCEHDIDRYELWCVETIPPGET